MKFLRSWFVADSPMRFYGSFKMGRRCHIARTLPGQGRFCFLDVSLSCLYLSITLGLKIFFPVVPPFFDLPITSSFMPIAFRFSTQRCFFCKRYVFPWLTVTKLK